LSESNQADLFDRIRFRGQPLANPDSVVVSGRARFTVLTSRLLRLEWSETGIFEDRGTYAFPTRHAPAPTFRKNVEGHTLVLDTGPLTLRYAQGSGKFTAANLSIGFELNGVPYRWTPGMAADESGSTSALSDPANLRGTRRTLDGCDGDAALEEGLLSRAGWAIFDDSRSVRFDPGDGWFSLPVPTRYRIGTFSAMVTTTRLPWLTMFASAVPSR
jgi:alpha-glucosidase